jgi:phytoene dehydrogenase-like protein
MSLLLSISGYKVLLIEKSPIIGGSLSRFSRRGIPFDTGFHFTGGLNEGGILSDMLSILGLRDSIEPIFLPHSAQNQFIFEAEGKRFEHPCGIEKIKSTFKGYFPAEYQAIDLYFEKVQSVCRRTPSLNLRENVIAPPNLEEDYVSLDSVLKGLTSNKLLRGLFSGYAMCYGVRPDEVSFANHSRMSLRPSTV